MRTNSSVSFSNRILIWFHPFSIVYHNRVTPQRALRMHRVTPRVRQHHPRGHICIGPAKRMPPGGACTTRHIYTVEMLSYLRFLHCTASVLVLLCAVEMAPICPRKVLHSFWNACDHTEITRKCRLNLNVLSAKTNKQRFWNNSVRTSIASAMNPLHVYVTQTPILQYT